MRARLALIPLVAAAALFAGCATNNAGTGTTPAPTTPASNGVADLAADQILAKAQEAMTKAKAFHAKGKIDEDGTVGTIDITYVGDNMTGKIDAEGLSLEIIAIGKDAYIKGLDEILSTILAAASGAVPPAQVAQITAAVKGKYLKVAVDDPKFASFSELADKKKFVEGLKPEGALTKGEKKSVNGKPAIGLVDADKSVMYVATEGEPVILRFEKAGAAGSSTNAVDFDYSDSLEVKAPDAANVVDIAKLLGS